MKLLLLIILSISFTSSVSASEVASGKIVEVRSGPWYGQLVTFRVSPAPVAESCSTLGDRGDYVIDLSVDGAEAWLSLILTAKASQTDVQVWGTGLCVPVQGFKGEELQTIAIK